ncbi:unnamed protein product [Parnassius mnemosyne]|uniref:Uncharacterized protein n=1 Tax=Parnassius mnemosyne TaxID=213953 RepID=A0AAV1LSW6_9NEOP
MGKCLRIPASRGQLRVMLYSHRLKSHGVSPSSHIDRATGTLSHTFATSEHMACPPPRPPTSHAHRTPPCPMHEGHGAWKNEHSEALAFLTPVADLVCGSAANQDSAAEGRKSRALQY